MNQFSRSKEFGWALIRTRFVSWKIRRECHCWEFTPGHVKSHVHILVPQLHHTFNSCFTCFGLKGDKYGLCQPAPLMQTKLDLWLSLSARRRRNHYSGPRPCVPVFTFCSNSLSLLGAQNKDLCPGSQTFPSSLRLLLRRRLGCASKCWVLFVSRLRNMSGFLLRIALA